MTNQPPLLSLPLFDVRRRFQTEGADFTLGLRREYGDFVVARSPARLLLPDVYFPFLPDIIHTLLIDHHDHLIKVPLINNTLRSSFGDGLFTSGGDKWRRQRKLMQPTFRHDRIARFADQMVKHTLDLLDSPAWQNAMKSGTAIDIDAAMHALTFTIVVDALFTSDATADIAEIGVGMKLLGSGVGAAATSLTAALMPDWAPLPAQRRKRRGVARMNAIIYRMIAERRALGEADSPPDLLSLLLFARDADTGATMDDGQIRDELMTLFIAGHETTALTLSWAWALLGTHPEIEAALHHELDTVLEGKPPTASDLRHLPLLEQIVKETLRMYPPAWFVARQNTESIRVNGVTIPKGCIVFLVPYATQRDDRWFDDPAVFNPSRWTPDFEKSLPKGVFFPFGMGARVCIGSGFAQMEAALLLATMAQRVRVLPERFPTPLVGGITLAFDAPVQIKVERR